MIEFIHTADIHFGVENYGRLDPRTGIHSRLLDFERALNFCIDYAIEHSVDFFLFSGDAYKTAHPNPTQQRLLLQCFLRLFKAQIPIIIIVGNHDNPLSFGKAHALEIFGQIPVDGFYVIAKPKIISLHTKKGPVQIVGIPWPTRSTLALNAPSVTTASDITQEISASVTRLIAHCAVQLNPQIPAVLAGHLTVSTGIFSGSEKKAIYGTDPIFMPSQLALHPFDYVALGHLHRHQNLNATGHPAVVYSGSLERIDFGERKEEKGFCHVKIHSKTTTTYEFIKTPARPFIQIEVQLNAASFDHTDQILNELHKHQLQNAVIKIVYHLPAGHKDRVDMSAIQQACSAAHYIVGIFPVRVPEQRERRIPLKVDMNLQTLLENYFAAKPEYSAQQEKLIQKALLLQDELENENKY